MLQVQQLCRALGCRRMEGLVELVRRERRGRGLWLLPLVLQQCVGYDGGGGLWAPGGAQGALWWSCLGLLSSDDHLKFVVHLVSYVYQWGW